MGQQGHPSLLCLRTLLFFAFLGFDCRFLVRRSITINSCMKAANFLQSSADNTMGTTGFLRFINTLLLVYTRMV